MTSFEQTRAKWNADPIFRKEYRAYKAKMDLANALTRWMERIPFIGRLVRTFWFCVLAEGYRATLTPWGGIAFSFLNDGMKPTVWHTWRQVRHDHNDLYTGIYPGGSPKSLAQAIDWEIEYQRKRAHGLAANNVLLGLVGTDDVVQEIDERPINPAFDLECGD